MCFGSESESESDGLLYCLNDVSSSSSLESSEEELSGLLIFALDDGGVQVYCSVDGVLYCVWGVCVDDSGFGKGVENVSCSSSIFVAVCCCLVWLCRTRLDLANGGSFGFSRHRPRTSI